MSLECGECESDLRRGHFPGCSRYTPPITDHDFLPVAGHPDDDECTYRADGTDATYCGEPEYRHERSPL